MASDLTKLARAIEGLTYPSESDEPFDVFSWGPAGAGTARDAVAAHSTGREIKEMSVETFFAQLAESDDAARYQTLRKTLESELSELKVFRVGEGEVEVDICLIGKTPPGDWAGVHTVSIET